MSVKLYSEFINELIRNGIKVENLSLKQVMGSFKLYKLINV